MNIFLLEDEYAILKGIEQYLNLQNYFVMTEINGMQAYEKLLELPAIDFFILDINVPELSGLELLQNIRNLYPMTPVIMISSDISIDTIEYAYELGCNDYLKKPFHIKELDIKIAQITNKSRIVQLTPYLSYDLFSKQITKNGKVIALTKKEMKFLELLVSANGKLVTLEMIEEANWYEEAASSNAIRSLVKRLRQKIDNPELIKTVSGLGYKLELTS